jgi:hypothetical protein
MMAISTVRAKALCSAGELALVKASTRQEIGGHTAARLRQKETRARKLRDKWRDQATGQKRSAQAKAGSRDAGANKNSAEKAELFGEVLGRFTAQLAKTEAMGETAGPMGRRRSTKTSRSRTHRAARADVRGELAEAKRVIKAETKSKKKAAPMKAKAKAVVAARPVMSESAPATTMSKGADTAPKPKRSRVPMAAGATAIVAGREAQGLHVTKLDQIKASASAKQNRLKAGGLIRIQKNRSAANKRSQGRRDSR